MGDGDRSINIDHTNLYRAFRDGAFSKGFARHQPEERDIFDTVTLDVSEDAGALKTFFPVVTTTPHGTLRSGTSADGAPKLVSTQPIDANELLCIHGVSLEIPSQTYGGATTENRALLDIIAESVLDLKFDGDSRFSKRGGEILTGRPGMLAYVDAGSIAYRGPVERSSPFVLPVPLVINPGSTFEATLQLPTGTGTALNGTDNDAAIKLILHVWRARKGQPRGDVGSSLALAL
jgi:hypothetical protein